MSSYRKWYTLDMILILHILIAVSSVLAASYAYMRPTVTKLRATYSLVGLTLASGTYLVVMAPAHMVQACTSGLVYIGIVSLAILFARMKLAQMQHEV
jgi:hypothetical protein